MSQEQPQKEQQEALKYEDVFNVNGELAEQPIAPQDAAMMQSAEDMVFGQTQKGGPASVMQAAAAKNERSGVVSHEDTTQVAGDEGVTVAETQVPGRRIVTESVAEQILGQYVEPLPVTAGAEGDVVEAPIAIGEALAATALVAGEKPVEQSDAAAIRVAEARANGAPARLPADKAVTRQDAEGVMEAEIRNNPSLTAYPGGVAASVAAAARLNERTA
ncbi:Late embryogenesis abundant protein D-34 [Capsicum baccatum]|uniref:Late embryogenesis abundant protein D-34 n=1 Tax=Capsicum baccatum TaxID=33114 RepID=A0A2G2W0P0_CAPBA|nr:Late embryogenesis abundant protein D-34 [Capsicum baccatum]